MPTESDITGLFRERHEYRRFLRFLIRLKHDPNALEENALYDGSKRKITDLIAHEKEIRFSTFHETIVKAA